MNRPDARPVKHWILSLAVAAVPIAVFTGWNRAKIEARGRHFGGRLLRV